MEKNMARKKYNFIWILLIIVLGVVFAFSIYKIASTLYQYSEGERTYDSIASDFVSFIPSESEGTTAPATSDDEALITGGSYTESPTITDDGKCPLTVDFDALKAYNPDVIGWIYCKDTPINYPILQSTDNDYYLRRLLTRKYNIAGSIFMDYRFKSDFSSLSAIIYGHNMNDDSMFGTFTNYKKQEYYDEHPIVWLLTPNGNYKLELFAGYVTSSTSEAYTQFVTDKDLYDYVQRAIAQSTFTSPVEFAEGDRIITLSTCSYEYSTARYVLIGKLVEEVIE